MTRSILYHCTKRSKLNSILKNGIQPRKPEGIVNAKCGVYLSELKFDWMHNTTDETTVAGAMIEVNVKGLKLLKDNGIILQDNKAHPAYYATEIIPVERFISICVSSDKNLACFEHIKF